MTVVCLVGNQLIGGLKRDVVDIAPELGRQVGPPPNEARPTGEVVEDLVNDVVGDDVEEVLAINKVAQRPSNQVEIRVGAQRISDSAFRTLGALRKIAYKRRATYKSEACLEEGTLRSARRED